MGNDINSHYPFLSHEERIARLEAYVKLIHDDVEEIKKQINNIMYKLGWLVAIASIASSVITAVILTSIQHTTW